MNDSRRREMMGVSGGAIDLSMVDNAGNKRSSMTTANCYMVHKKGLYMIPLVYGNAVKNGAANTIAYNPGTVSNGCSNFINHANTAISGPWITKNGSSVNAGMGITVNGAQLIWQDAQNLVTDIAINGDYLTFKVADDASTKAGNAVIAAKSESTIVWSWHIWVTTETLSNTTVIVTGSHNYIVAPVNLGWIPTSSDGKHGYCPYYQWGRKDPFVPSNGIDNTDKTVYVGSGVPATGYDYKKNAVTIGTNIQKPWTHYHYTSFTGPVSTTYYNMWDAQNSSTSDNVSTATKKTIYDPCPPGFCVPTGNLYNYIYSNYSSYLAWDDTDKGRLWSKNTPNVWFPALGIRKYDSASLISVGSYGNYWSATPCSNESSHGRAYQFYFYSNNVYWNYTARSGNNPVRPVVEE